MFFKIPHKESEKGISLIITFFIMMIVLAVVFSLSALLYSEIKVLRNIGNSVVAFFAADSGVEKVLFYDSQVVPEGAQRGLCSMVSYNPVSNPNACQPDPNQGGLDEHGIYCNGGNATPQDQNVPQTGCADCSNCMVVFDTQFDNRSYLVEAAVAPSEDQNSTDFTIKSKGIFGGTERKIQVLTNFSKTSGEAIQITQACANPVSAGQGQTIEISAFVTASSSDYSIQSVDAQIRNAQGNLVGEVVLSPNCPSEGECNYNANTWSGAWSTSQTGAYSVDIIATNTAEPQTQVSKLNISPCLGE